MILIFCIKGCSYGIRNQKIISIQASLSFDRTSASYMAEFVDDDSLDQTFISNYDYFFCLSLIADGEILILNSMGYY